jgi:ornithine cyclodeaminase
MRCVSEEEVEDALPAAGVVAAVAAALAGGGAVVSAAPDAGDGIVTGRAQIAVSGQTVGVLAGATSRTGDGSVLTVFDAGGRPLACIAANWLTRITAAAAATVAIRTVAPRPPAVAAVIGSGPLARAAVLCLDEVLGVTPRHGPPRDAQRLARDADVVVTATRARDPVVRDDWLSEGTLVAALGATGPDERELDYRTLVRAALVLCDSAAEARRRSADLIETVAAGHLDWLEVHELAEAVSGDLEELVRPADVVVYKGLGSAALVLAAAAPLITSAI